MTDAIERVGGYARDDRPAHLVKGLSRETPSDPHPLDGLEILDFGSGEALGRRAIDVLGARNVDGDGPTRGLDSGDKRRPRDGHGRSVGVSGILSRRR